jgi:hypothetical protein
LDPADCTADPCGICRSLSSSTEFTFLLSRASCLKTPSSCTLVYAWLQAMIILDDSPDSQKRRLVRRASSSSDADSVGSSQIRPPSYRSVGLRYQVQPMLGAEPPQSSDSLPEQAKVGYSRWFVSTRLNLF